MGTKFKHRRFKLNRVVWYVSVCPECADETRVNVTYHGRVKAYGIRRQWEHEHSEVCD